MAALDFSRSYEGRWGALTHEAVGRISALLQQAVRDLGVVIRQEWPDDTGRSLSSWRLQVRGLIVIVANPVDYASFVRFEGTEEGSAGRFVEAELERLLAGIDPEMAAIAAADRFTAAQQGGRDVSFAAQPPAATTSHGLSVLRGMVTAFTRTLSRERNRLQRQGVRFRDRDRTRTRPR